MKNAIVIDDDPDFVDSFSDLLEMHQIRVVGKGYDGKDAVNLCMKFVPEIIFLDVMMPNHDGITALEIIKEVNKNAKVIIITANMTPKTQQTLAHFGVSAIMYKPINMTKILNLV